MKIKIQGIWYGAYDEQQQKEKTNIIALIVVTLIAVLLAYFTS